METFRVFVISGDYLPASNCTINDWLSHTVAAFAVDVLISDQRWIDHRRLRASYFMKIPHPVTLSKIKSIGLQPTVSRVTGRVSTACGLYRVWLSLPIRYLNPVLL